MRALSLVAPAKLNLYLRVLGRRADGYHELESLFQTLDLGDTLSVRAGAQDFSLQIVQQLGRGLAVESGADNLVLRAARSYRDAGGQVGGLDFRLHKCIPAGGGLGGGSSDAAAALRLCEAFSARPLGAARLGAIAAGLGADVAFFLRGGSQWGTGVGERLQEVRGVPHWYFLLLMPPLGTATPAVYENLAADLTVENAPARIPADRACHYQELSLPTGFPNDLEAAALDLHPELADWAERIKAQGYPSLRMSGSGSTFFLAFDTAAERDAAAAALSPLEAQGLGLVPTASRADLPQPRPLGGMR